HLSPWYENILKLKADAKFESGNVKATVAVLSFVLSSAAKHSVDGGCLFSELQQLRLPKGTGCGWAAGQPVGQGLLERGPGPVTLRCILPCLDQEFKPSPHLLPPELLRSTPRARGQPVPFLHLGSATYAVSMRPASARAHSRRFTQHAKCMESPGR
uniref:Uncharacterized protein n=1 Tax=Papio anubis TaxID=9555 RepID=A0A8I5MWE2_PAPAN